MKIFSLLIIYLGFILSSTFPQTNIPNGNVSGIWTLANSPYYINGEITIPKYLTLTIEPGVEIIFTGHYKFNVQGRLLAVGTKTDTIRFSAVDKEAGWHGIRFINTPIFIDTSKIIYCSFKFGKANTGDAGSLDRCGGAIMIFKFDKVLISNCLFESNMTTGDVFSTGGPGICAFYSSPTITKSTFIYNDGSGGSAGAIRVGFNSKAIISNNIISNNKCYLGAIICGNDSANQPIISGNIISNNTAVGGGGILVYGSSNARFENNLIIHNQASFGGGIYVFSYTNPVFVNNTIAFNKAGNGGGICCEGYVIPDFKNNIIYGNSAVNGSQVYISDLNSSPAFQYNNIQGGKEEFAGTGAGTNYAGIFENNINLDPFFTDKEKDDFHLSDSSRCIGAGEKDSCPKYDIEGFNRPNPAGSNPDLGAYESSLETPVTNVEIEPAYPTEFIVYQNYPNPFNPNTRIRFAIISKQFVTIKIYDPLGREITTLVNEEKPAGIYEVTWNAVNLPSGVYFYQLKAATNGGHEGNFTATKKLLLIK